LGGNITLGFFANSLGAALNSQIINIAFNGQSFNVTGFEADFANSFTNAVGSYVGSQLGAELAKDLGLPIQLGSLGGSVLGAAAATQLEQYIAQQIGGDFAKAVGQSTFWGQVKLSGAAALGQYLGAEVSSALFGNTADSQIGGQIGSQLGAYIGQTVACPHRVIRELC
jgi:hypothetical protein